MSWFLALQLLLSLSLTSSFIIPISPIELSDFLSNSTKTSIVFLKDAECELEPKCQMNFKIFTNCSQKLDSMVNFLTIECKNGRFQDFCQIEKDNILIYEVYKSKVHRIKEKDLVESLLEGFLEKIVEVRSAKLNFKEELLDFLEEDSELNTALLFYNTSEIPFSYKVITNSFLGKLRLGHIHSSSKEIIEHYAIKRFPSFLLLKRNMKNLTEFYKFEFKSKSLAVSNHLNYTDLSVFLKKYSAKKPVTFHSPPETAEMSAYLFNFAGLESEWKEIRAINVNITNKNVSQFPNDKVNLIHIFENQQTFEQYPLLIEKLSTLVNYYALNCSGKKAEEKKIYAKEVFNVSQLPTLVILKEGRKVNFFGSGSLFEIIENISNLINDRSTELKDERQMEKELSDTFKENKIFFILFHKTEVTSMSFRMLSNLQKYRDYVNFAHFYDPSIELRRKYNILNDNQLIAIVPKALINENGGTIVISFRGKWVSHEIAKFLHFTLIKYLGDQILKLIREIKTENEYDLFCDKNSNAFCFFGILSSVNFQNEVKILERVKESFNEVELPMFYMKESCQQNLISELKIEDENIPAFFAYNLIENSVAILKDDLNDVNLFNFMASLDIHPFKKLTTSLPSLLDDGFCSESTPNFHLKEEL